MAVRLVSQAHTASHQTAAWVTSSPVFYVVIDVTAVEDTPSFTCAMEMWEGVSSEWIEIWVTAVPITAVGTYVYLFTNSTDPIAKHNDITEVNEVIISVEGVRLSFVHADADSITYSVANLEAVM